MRSSSAVGQQLRPEHARQQTAGDRRRHAAAIERDDEVGHARLGESRRVYSRAARRRHRAIGGASLVVHVTARGLVEEQRAARVDRCGRERRRASVARRERTASLRPALSAVSIEHRRGPATSRRSDRAVRASNAVASRSASAAHPKALPTPAVSRHVPSRRTRIPASRRIVSNSDASSGTAAGRTTRALARHSAHSSAAVESAVIPAPTLNVAMPVARSRIAVRIGTLADQVAARAAAGTPRRCTGRAATIRASAMISIVRTLGAPVTDPQGNTARNRSHSDVAGRAWRRSAT